MSQQPKEIQAFGAAATRGPAAKPARHRPELRWWGALPVLALVVVVAISVTRGLGGPYAISAKMGQFVGVLLVAALLAMVGFWIARRSSLIFNIVFAVVVGLQVVRMGVGLATQPTRQEIAAREQALTSLRSSNEELSAKIMESYKQGRVPDAKTDTEQRVELLRKTSESLKDDDKRAVEAMADFARDIGGTTAVFNDALQAVVSAGGTDPSTLKTRAMIDERIGLVETLAAANDTLAQKTRELSDGLEQRFETAGVSEEVRKRYLAGMTTRMATLFRLRDVQRELFRAMLSQLRLLRDSWGKWEFDAASQLVMFEEDEPLERFGSSAARIQELATEENVLMQRLHE